LRRQLELRFFMSIFDTIILLTGQVEQPVLAAALLACNPLLTIQLSSTLTDLLALDAEVLSHARLVAFSTNVIVPAQILRQLGFGAYNFHPGAPDFPGWAPAYFALYKGATHFGATAHVMVERIDEGPIIGVELFRIPDGITAAGLEGLAYGHLARLFWRFAKPLATESAPLPELSIKWSEERASRRLFKSMFDLPPGISDSELIETIRANIR
jgi:methionyl-tRNA formyltransferase